MYLLEPESHLQLSDYDERAHLVSHVRELRAASVGAGARLRGRTVWMVSSTAQGGGVAEMMPRTISMLRELGVDARWVILESRDERFFVLTKRLHNLLHGQGDPDLSAADREVYERVSRENAEELLGRLRPDDILVTHDPQPLGMAAFLKDRTGMASIWRCHIGLDEPHPACAAAWAFLRPYTARVDRSVFSLAEYIPGHLAGRASVSTPAIDPISHKNRELSVHKLVGVLCDASLVVPHWPLLHPPFTRPALRLQPDGSLAPANQPDDIGLLCRPTVTQVSRWDRLKGWLPLLEAFRLLKLGRAGRRAAADPLHARRLRVLRLVLAAADPAGVSDDPEGEAVLGELRARALELEEPVRRDVAVLVLPMVSAKENALMVNALQRSASVVVQNSLREGFGLTVSEAMWKRAPILGSARAAGIRFQVRNGQDGRLAPPDDPAAIAELLDEMLADRHARERWGLSGQRRVHEEFLIFKQMRGWLRLLEDAPVASLGAPGGRNAARSSRAGSTRPQ